MLKKVATVFVVLLFLCSIFTGLDRVIHRKKKGIVTFKVTAFQPYSPEWDSSPLNPQEQQEIDQILNQKFTYLNKGSQAYVFLSEDKKYVLKFIKQHSLQANSWLCYLPFSFNPYYRNYIYRQKKLHDTYHACKMAFTDFKNETGLIYLHLNPTRHLNRKLTLFDKKGEILEIDSDRSCFLIQKKANLIYSRIAEVMANQDIERAKKIISSVFSLMDFLGSRGVIDNDPILRKNFGLIDDKAVQIDIGKMGIDPSRIHSSVHKQEIKGITAHFRIWIEQNYPELVSHFDESLESTIQTD
jgi:hypothetical protein